jgi:hypothetical protein
MDLRQSELFWRQETSNGEKTSKLTRGLFRRHTAFTANASYVAKYFIAAIGLGSPRPFPRFDMQHLVLRR